MKKITVLFFINISMALMSFNSSQPELYIGTCNIGTPKHEYLVLRLIRATDYQSADKIFKRCVYEDTVLKDGRIHPGGYHIDKFSDLTISTSDKVYFNRTTP